MKTYQHAGKHGQLTKREQGNQEGELKAHSQPLAVCMCPVVVN